MDLCGPYHSELYRTLRHSLVLVNGNLYGAYATGPDGVTGGAVFELQPPASAGGAWSMTTLHTFTSGQLPIGNLVLTGNGTIFGSAATYPTGQPAIGTVFAITMK